MNNDFIYFIHVGGLIRDKITTSKSHSPGGGSEGCEHGRQEVQVVGNGVLPDQGDVQQGQEKELVQGDASEGRCQEEPQVAEQVGGGEARLQPLPEHPEEHAHGEDADYKEETQVKLHAVHRIQNTVMSISMNSHFK